MVSRRINATRSAGMVLLTLVESGFALLFSFTGIMMLSAGCGEKKQSFHCSRLPDSASLLSRMEPGWGSTVLMLLI